jgi:hypothetical protein
LRGLQLARVGWFFRYEAWLMGAGLALLAETLFEAARPRLAGALAVSVALLLLPRAVRAHGLVVPAAKNIFDQQRQMGLFLSRELPDASVALNDIGEVSWLSDVHLLDLMGLASIDVARALRERRATPAVLQELLASHRVEVALVHARLFRGALPRSWIEVGTWRVPDNVLLGEDTVTFFARDQSVANNVRAALQRFQPSLPDGIETKIFNAPGAR